MEYVLELTKRHCACLCGIMPFVQYAGVMKTVVDDEKLILRRAEDLAALAEKYNTARFSDFFDENEQAVISAGFFHKGSVWFGGNAQCARRMLGIFPSWWCDAYDEEFPISVLYVKNKGRRELSHRDYLGALMSLGLERKKVGDICVLPDGAYVFMTSAAALHAEASIEKIADCRVECSVIPFSQVQIPEAKFELADIVAASLRLDAVVSAVCTMSRRTAGEYIASGRVSVNHRPVQKCDYTLKEEDMLSLRGYGRVQIINTGGKTRSDRLHITIKKFI